MSLIVEALKKSEAKRRLGHAPDVNAPAIWARVHPQRESAMPWLWLALILLGLIGLGALWWLLSSQAPVPVQAEKPGSSKPVTHQSNPPKGNDALAKFQRGEFVAPDKEAIEPSSESSNPELSKPAEVMQTVELPPTPPPSVVEERATFNAPPLPELETRPLRDSTPVETVIEEKGPALPFDWELAKEMRDRMPALKISMHFYAADPAKRFVLLNGARYTEGATVAKDLVLQEIQRDGIVLAFEGQRFVKANPKP